ncbi:MAG: transposase [Acidobacteria bacterium]|nr:transposase [Acidobacteriota bacterium]
MQAWQNRPLDALYSILHMDALQFKVRDEATVRNKAVYLARDVNKDGMKRFWGCG